MGSCLIVGSAYHKNTNAKVEWANGVIGDTLRAYANGRKDLGGWVGGWVDEWVGEWVGDDWGEGYFGGWVRGC